MTWMGIGKILDTFDVAGRGKCSAGHRHVITDPAFKTRCPSLIKIIIFERPIIIQTVEQGMKFYQNQFAIRVEN